MTQKAVELIKEFEGLALNAYVCPAGYLTIGYGHRITGKDKKSLTLPEAIALLNQDIAAYTKSVTALLKAPTHTNQLSALISFAYNLGINALADSTLLKLHNRGDYAGAAAEFERWVKARVGGKLTTLKGLVRRRKAEKAVYLTPVGA